MERLNLSTRTKLAAGFAAVATIVGVSVATLSGDDYRRETAAVLEDAGVSRESGERRVADLLTAPVDPGDEVVTGGALPLGWRVESVSPAGPFEILTQTHEDRETITWYTITVRNSGPAPARFVAWIEFALPGADADGGTP